MPPCHGPSRPPRQHTTLFRARLPTRLTRLSCRSEPALHAASGMSGATVCTGAGRRQRTSSRSGVVMWSWPGGL